MFYHGTNNSSGASIEEHGFKRSYGRYGACVYFTNDKTQAKVWGKHLIELDINDLLVKHISYSDVALKYPSISIEEEEGVPTIYKDIGMGYDAINIIYDDGENELCIYNVDKLNNLL